MLITSPVQAFPNFSTSVTFTYSLDANGNCEIFSIHRVENIDFNTTWTPQMSLSIPITAVSYSDEQPEVTMVKVGDVDFPYSVKEYKRKTLHGSDSFLHNFYIEVYPSSPQTLYKDNKVTIRTKSIINNSTLKYKDYNKFTIPGMYLPMGESPFEKIEHFIVRVNLPNDPYYMSEILDTSPPYDFRNSYGRGESLEWRYRGNENHTKQILIDYRIHPDPLKQELDKATKQSLYISNISLLIATVMGFVSILLGVLSILLTIKDKNIKMNWIIDKLLNIRNYKFKDTVNKIIKK